MSLGAGQNTREGGCCRASVPHSPLACSLLLGHKVKDLSLPLLAPRPQPYTIAANVFWAVSIGWAFVLLHLLSAVVHALTIIGIGTALTNVELASYVM